MFLIQDSSSCISIFQKFQKSFANRYASASILFFLYNSIRMFLIMQNNVLGGRKDSSDDSPNLTIVYELIDMPLEVSSILCFDYSVFARYY